MKESSVQNFTLGEKLVLFINKRFRPLPHPFNDKKNKDQKLSYTDFEYNLAYQTAFKAFEGGNLDFLKSLNDKEVLDIACGGGGKSIWLAENTELKTMTGIDISKNFIDQAKKFAAEKNLSEKIKFKVASAKELPFKDNSFDVVFLNDALEHIPNPEKALKEASRVIRPGGSICINLATYYHAYGHHLTDVISIPWLHVFTTEQFRIKLYKKLVQNLPDGQERINFRIGKINEKEKFTYLNHISTRKFKKILKNLRKNNNIKCSYYFNEKWNNPVLKFLTGLPVLDELLVKQITCVLSK
ncbi:class I SAM-dependent methyltransferase [Candidatus Peregrinibacteria bacterium]|nr:class I SAM-dependent methyltransferase [Candidatus Peregrinibacteria bacterium]